MKGYKSISVYLSACVNKHQVCKLAECHCHKSIPGQAFTELLLYIHIHVPSNGLNNPHKPQGVFYKGENLLVSGSCQNIVFSTLMIHY